MTSQPITEKCTNCKTTLKKCMEGGLTWHREYFKCPKCFARFDYENDQGLYDAHAISMEKRRKKQEERIKKHGKLIGFILNLIHYD